ncbi:MAG: hypothetical protein JO030_05620, partial [Candidatus Eremiobacteraeota bacterium]|nr:hypothetical protein [Candidatus Eremiobacteraeota bacterium]
TEEGIWISFDGGAHWQAFRNNLPPVSVHDIRLQAREDDLVIATHGRSVYIMDDVRPLQELQRAIGQKTWLFTPRTSYEWTLHQNDEGTYTNYAADNPPNGVVMTFYQSDPQKGSPKLEILDAHGRVIRTVSGTHKVNDEDEPYIANKVGLNRYTWDFNVNGPVRWNAGNDFSKGPETGPGVVPGDYAVRMTLAGRTYLQRFRVAPDPRSKFTQADYQRTFNMAMRVMAHLSTVDTMLNNIDDVKKALDNAVAAATKANNVPLLAKLKDAQTARQTLFDSLAVNIRGEGTMDEGRLHEDLLGAFGAAQGLITPAVADAVARVEVAYRAGVGRYNAFVTGVLPGVSASLRQAGMKELPPMKTVSAL